MRKVLLILAILFSYSNIYSKDFPFLDGISIDFSKTVKDLEKTANDYTVKSIIEKKVKIFKITPKAKKYFYLCNTEIESIKIGDFKGNNISGFKICCNAANYEKIKTAIQAIANKYKGEGACFFDNCTVHFLNKEKEIMVLSKTFFEDIKKLSK